MFLPPYLLSFDPKQLGGKPKKSMTKDTALDGFSPVALQLSAQ